MWIKAIQRAEKKEIRRRSRRDENCYRQLLKRDATHLVEVYRVIGRSPAEEFV